MIMITEISEVLTALRDAVQEGVRNAATRDEHLRWSRVMAHIESLERSPGGSSTQQ